jgi:GT2 family glycosyltransferase
MTIYLLTVNYYSSKLIARLIHSLPRDTSLNYELIIVNNSVHDEAIANLARENIQLINAPENLGFGQACNLGLNWLYSSYPNTLVWLINPDAYLLENSLQQAQEFFSSYPEVAIAGTEIYEPEGNIWFGYGEFNRSSGTITVAKQSATYNNQPYLTAVWVTGCSTLINFKHFPCCPQFDPDYFLYYEDFDFSRRYSEQGYLVVITNQIKIIHEPSSITLRYGHLRLTHNIYSYLLSLEKHSSFIILWSRFIRMVIMALLLIPIKPKFALAKLQGIKLFLQKRYVKYCT